MEFEMDSNPGTDPTIEVEAVPATPDPAPAEPTLPLEAVPETMDARPSSDTDDTIPRPQTAYERTLQY